MSPRYTLTLPVSSLGRAPLPSAKQYTQSIANGEKNIQLPRPYARTKYSAIEGLEYLSTEDASDWANVYMALYYGFDSIIGY